MNYAGFVNAETASVLSGAVTYGGASQGAVNGGTYAIIPSGLTSSNYDITFASGTLTVNKAALTVTAAADSKTYNGLAYSGGNGVTYAGFVNAETVAVLAGTLTYTGTSQGAVNAGSYVIAPGGLSSDNYAFTYVSGALTVNKAALTVTANNDAKLFSTTDAPGYAGVSYSGFVNGETAAVLGGTLAISRSNAGTETAGTYTGVLVPSRLTSWNYTFSYQNGNYTIFAAF